VQNRSILSGSSGVEKKRIKIYVRGLVSLGIMGLLIWFAAAFEQEQNALPIPSGKCVVIVVYDGDTIKVRFDNGVEERIRLIGIDTPEMNEEDEDLRFHALIAKRFSFYYLYRQTVELSYDRTLRDDYGRLLAYIWLEDETLFNEFILREGFASSLLRFPFRKDLRQRFIQAEKEAKDFEKGIWQKRPLPVIDVRNVGKNIGKLISVEYFCKEVEDGSRFIFLHSKDVRFSALIPKENKDLFPLALSYSGKQVVVTGFLEEFKGKPEILLFLPSQIQIRSRNISS
jgi:micrococcal nuclease